LIYDEKATGGAVVINITSQIFAAHLECPTKSWLLATGEPRGDNAYAHWVNEQSDCYYATKIATLVSGSPIVEIVASPVLVELLASTWQLATKIALRLTLPSCVLDSEIHALERLPTSTHKAIDIIPIRFVFTNHFTAADKLILAFDAFILSEILGLNIHKGKIVYGTSESIVRFNVSDMFDTVRTRVEHLAVHLSSHVPPELVLNRHCGECEFRNRCL
jgi:CRISPR/Cas system-associated exonuclease Cas4 (RecB family)